MPEVLVAASHEAVRKRLGRTQLGDISARRKLGVARCTRSSGGVEVFRSLVSVRFLTAALSRVRRSSRADDAEPAYYEYMPVSCGPKQFRQTNSDSLIRNAGLASPVQSYC